MIKVLGADFPMCAHDGCKKHGEDGYCLASCCCDDDGEPRSLAYCSEHSHRPALLLEILSYPPSQQTFTRDEVERIVKAMWIGAGMVFESGGYFSMIRDVRLKRESEGGNTDGLNGIKGNA